MSNTAGCHTLDAFGYPEWLISVRLYSRQYKTDAPNTKHVTVAHEVLWDRAGTVPAAIEETSGYHDYRDRAMSTITETTAKRTAAQARQLTRQMYTVYRSNEW